MRFDDFISRCDCVRRSGRGVVARCPAHDDRTPSLSILEGDDGRVVLHCFAGCTAGDIVAAMGLELRDLFRDPCSSRGQQLAPRLLKLDRVALAFRCELTALDRQLRAEQVLRATSSLDASNTTDDHLDRLINAVALAYLDLNRADVLDHVADLLREKAYRERTTCYAA